MTPTPKVDDKAISAIEEVLVAGGNSNCSEIDVTFQQYVSSNRSHTINVKALYRDKALD